MRPRHDVGMGEEIARATVIDNTYCGVADRRRCVG
jgi:hypothetical protein